MQRWRGRRGFARTLPALHAPRHAVCLLAVALIILHAHALDVSRAPRHQLHIIPAHAAPLGNATMNDTEPELVYAGALIHPPPTAATADANTSAAAQPTCENATHCACRIVNVKMLSLYTPPPPPEATQAPPLSSSASAAASSGTSTNATRRDVLCELRPRGARVSYRCACESNDGDSLCRKVSTRNSTQPLGDIEEFERNGDGNAARTGNASESIFGGYWHRRCTQREGAAVKPVCRSSRQRRRR